MDYMSAYLRINHYLGSYDAFAERGPNKILGEAGQRQYDKKHRDGQYRGPSQRFADQGDDDIRPWFDEFHTQIGSPALVQKLLHRTMSVQRMVPS